MSRLARTVCRMTQENRLFQVRCETQPGEVLALTGSSCDLGSWRKGGVVPMVQDDEDRSLWQVSVSLSSTEVHQYRYCVVVILQVTSLFPREHF